MRILLTDIVFPNKYAKWRLVEIYSFMQQYDTDILILNRIDKYAGINLSFDYDELVDFFNLRDYNILIFDSKYNHLNKYNVNFDGIKYNGKINSCYLIRHKKFNDDEFSLDNYDNVYHIFLMNYNNFNLKFKFPLEKQIIHLYPGGGLINKNSLLNLSNATKIISTQSFVSDFLKELKITNKTLDLMGGPFFFKNENINLKQYDNEKLTVCFTSLGNIYEKGADKYVKIVDLFFKNFGDDLNISFLSIGNCPQHKNIINLKPMDQTTLSNFYLENIDVLINLDSGKTLNGFPLGIEAIIQGCLLLTTDIHNANNKNNFNFDSFFIIDSNNLEGVVVKLKYLYDNRNICKEKSIELQKKSFDLFNYENHMKKIFEFIEFN